MALNEYTISTRIRFIDASIAREWNTDKISQVVSAWLDEHAKGLTLKPLALNNMFGISNPYSVVVMPLNDSKYSIDLHVTIGFFKIIDINDLDYVFNKIQTSLPPKREYFSRTLENGLKEITFRTTEIKEYEKVQNTIREFITSD